jgi:thiol-disulfide isomerase/thioredoxin
MERVAFCPARKLVVGSIALTLAGVTAFPPSAFSAPRVVLAEEFTATWCGACNSAAPVISDLIDFYGVHGTDPARSGTFAAVICHVSDDYSTPWGEGRAGFYGVTGLPTFMYDGLFDAWPISAYKPNYLQRLAVPTPVTMELGVVEATPNQYEITVETCLELDADAVGLRIYGVVVEDHYPTSPTYWRNDFRAAAPTADIDLAPGECETVVLGQVGVIPMTQQKANLKVIAWAQEQSSHWPADVYQAAIDAYPFDPAAPPCPWDCGNDDGNVGVNDFLMMIAGWGGPGSCDFDGGGVINVADFLELLANWGPCPE